MSDNDGSAVRTGRTPLSEDPWTTYFEPAIRHLETWLQDTETTEASDG
jgi:hypothetical protein